MQPLVPILKTVPLLQMLPINYSVTLHKAGKACQLKTLQLIEPILQVSKKMKCCPCDSKPWVQILDIPGKAC
jgi:hypothetical protein